MAYAATTESHPATGAGGTIGQLAPIGVAVFVTLLVALWVLKAPNVGGDTPVLVNGAADASRCLHDGTLTKCGLMPGEQLVPGGTYRTSVGPWPPLQMVPSVLLIELGVSQQQVFTALVLIGLFVLLGGIALAALAAERSVGPGFGALVAFATLFSPFLYYGGNSFGEALAAGVTLAFCALLVLRAPLVLIAAGAFATTVTKETAAPFVVALAALLVHHAWRREGRPWRPPAIAVAAGVAAGIALIALLNVFRYGSVRNLDLLREEFRVPGVGLRAEFLGALIGSPNGGIVWFWPVAVALFALLVVAALRGRDGRTGRIYAVALLGVAGALLAGLASYHTPFGWLAYGPRLTLPWIPALVFVAVVLFGDRAAGAMRALARRRSLALALALGAAVVSMPHVGAVFDPTAWRNIYAPTGPCTPESPPLPPDEVYTDRYYRCVKDQAWSRGPVLVDAYRGLRSPPGVLLALGLVAGALGLVAMWREGLLRPRPT